MSVTLRKKSLKTPRYSLYLDYYPPIKHPDTGLLTRREFLELYILKKPKTDLERETNKKIYLLAENVCAKRLIEIQNNRFGFLANERKEAIFIDYFKKIAAKKTGTNASGWDMAWRYFESYSGPNFRFLDLTEDFCEEYRDYMLSGPGIGRYGKLISHNTASSYFAKLRAMLKIVYRVKLTDDNLYETVLPIKENDVIREFLTIEEFKTLVSTPIEDSVMRRASIFAVLTGLRFCDHKALLWAQVRGCEGNYYIQFTQEKTAGAETFPISSEAYHILGMPGDPDSPVFPELRYSRLKPFLTMWLNKAGIVKSSFTFHCLRHTYATLQLALGTDIFTLMKMLGHRSIKSTMRYLHLLDQSKKDTTQKIKIKELRVIFPAS